MPHLTCDFVESNVAPTILAGVDGGEEVGIAGFGDVAGSVLKRNVDELKKFSLCRRPEGEWVIPAFVVGSVHLAGNLADEALQIVKSAHGQIDDLTNVVDNAHHSSKSTIGNTVEKGLAEVKLVNRLGRSTDSLVDEVELHTAVDGGPGDTRTNVGEIFFDSDATLFRTVLQRLDLGHRFLRGVGEDGNIVNVGVDSARSMVEVKEAFGSGAAYEDHVGETSRSDFEANKARASVGGRNAEAEEVSDFGGETELMVVRHKVDFNHVVAGPDEAAQFLGVAEVHLGSSRNTLIDLLGVLNEAETTFFFFNNREAESTALDIRGRDVLDNAKIKELLRVFRSETTGDDDITGSADGHVLLVHGGVREVLHGVFEVDAALLGGAGKVLEGFRVDVSDDAVEVEGKGFGRLLLILAAEFGLGGGRSKNQSG